MESNQEWENTRDERAEVFGVKKGINQILKCGAVTWILLLVIWQIGSLFYTDDFLPGPATTFAGAGVLIEDGTLATDISVSLQRVLRGWLLGVIFAVPVGLCIGNFKKVGWVLEPFLNFFRFVPAIGFITLFLMWFGVGENSKTALIFYAVIFPVMINTIAGVRAVDQSLVEASRSLGASWPKVFFKVIIPNLWQSILSASFISIAVVLGEYTVASLLGRMNLQVALYQLGQSNSQISTAMSLLALLFGAVLLVALDLISDAMRKSREGK